MGLLTGIKVIDLTRFVAGPHCTLVLSDLGADVIKIEKRGKGDDLRIIGPKLLHTSLWAGVLNKGKKSLSLDLKTRLGRDILLQLIKESDVIVENFRPGVMEKLKLDWPVIKKVNKKIIMARISGYGQEGSLDSRQAFDATVQAETGFMQISGHDDKPTMIGTVFLDYTTGLNTAVGILAALNARYKTGKGELIETSLVNSALALSMEAVPNFFLNKSNFGKNGNSDRFSSPSNTYKAKNGFLHIMAGSDDRFYNLLKAMNRTELFSNNLFNNPVKRLTNQNKIDRIVSNWTKNKTTTFLGKTLSKHGVPWGKVNSFSEFLKSKTASKNITKAKVSNRSIKVPTCAIKVKRKKSPNKFVIPKVGQNNNEILKKLGYNNKQILELKKKRIID